MNRTDFARNIAQSLTLGSWSVDTFSATLLRRFPPVLHRFVPGIASELMLLLPDHYAPSSRVVAKTLFLIPDFERVFQHCKVHNVWPMPDLSTPVMSPIPAFSDLDLPALQTIKDLADWVFLPVERLDYLADLQSRHEENGETSINHYHYVLKTKKSGGIRVIEAPKQTLKSIQRQILRGIIAELPNHPDAFGFVQGRNCLQAANRHAGEEVVVNFDLRDFFPSISAGRVFGLFRCLGYPNSVARYLTGLCTTATPPRILERLEFGERVTYRKPHLPQGSPVSPALANHVAFGLDRRLSGLGRRLGAKYSRYADDLSFSGDRQIIGPLLKAVPQIARDEGFHVNPAKTRVMPKGARQSVTGIVVNQHLNINRTSFDTLKATIHACGKEDDTRLSDPRFMASLVGKIEWVETVNRRRGQKLRHLLAATLSQSD